jgi:hypothetical protein
MNILIAIHVTSGLIGIAAGLIVVAGMFRRKAMNRWFAIFLATTSTAICVGFYFLPIYGFTTAQLVSVFTTVFLLVAAYARYFRRSAGSWNQICAVSTVAALYLNVLITITQSFQHVRFLRSFSTVPGIPVYVIIKFAALFLFIAIGFFAARRSADHRV